MNEQMNYYQILEIQPNTPSQEIRKAYIKKIRQYPNETHPKEFQLIRKAYETLSDEKKREEYNRTGQDDGFYQKLLAEAQQAMNNGKYHQAVQLLERLTSKYPEDPVARYHKAYALIEVNRMNEAKNIANQLRLDEPNNIEYLELAAVVYYRMEDYNRSINLLEKIIQLVPDEPSFYLRLSNIYYELNDVVKAMNALERRLYKGETIHEFALLQELYYLTVVKEDRSYYNNVIKRIKKLPKDESEKQLLIEWLIDDCERIGHQHGCYPDLIDMIDYLNNGQNAHVNQWLKKAYRLVNQSPNVHRETAAAATPTYRDTYVDDGRGSILTSIIVGIIFSFIGTPILGLVAGFIYYFNARKIKLILSWIIGIIVVVIIFSLILI